MDSFLSISQLAKLQHISRQCLIYYDRIGLFTPAYVDEENGYRYYRPSQVDELETIILLKRMGLSLDEIKKEMKGYTTTSALETLDERIRQIDSDIKELEKLRSHLTHRYRTVKEALKFHGGEIRREKTGKLCIYTHPVKPPYTLDLVSLATQECIGKALKEGVNILYQSGAILPKEALLNGDYLATDTVFLLCESNTSSSTVTLEKGDTVSIYHRGSYRESGESYEKLLAYCNENGLEIISPSYEFALNDYLTTREEGEYITRLMVYVKP